MDDKILLRYTYTYTYTYTHTHTHTHTRREPVYEMLKKITMTLSSEKVPINQNHYGLKQTASQVYIYLDSKCDVEFDDD